MEQDTNVASCLSKVDGTTHMNNHLILYLVTRMLSVFDQMSEHGLPLSDSAVEAFKRVEEAKDRFGDAFALLKDRIEKVSTQLECYELQMAL